MNGYITASDVKSDLEYTKELFYMVKRNKKNKDIVLSNLISLFTDCATIISTFPEHEKLSQYFVELRCSDDDIPQEDLDLLLISINAAIKDVERAIKNYQYQEILFEGL